VSFDGKYAGTATATAGRFGGGMCSLIQRMEMTITAGQVLIRETEFNGPGPTYQGNVNAAGEVSASFQSKQLPTDVGGQNIIMVYGTIHNNAFTGTRDHASSCYHHVEMVEQSAYRKLTAPP
jgi:hypothetical protein